MKKFTVRLSNNMPVIIQADNFHIDEKHTTVTFSRNDLPCKQPVDGYIFFTSNILFIKEENTDAK